jgi:activator of HSP90 ATPase
MDAEGSRQPTRRQILVGATAALSGLDIGVFRNVTQIDDGVFRAAESIHQEVVFKATPTRLYEALTDANQFEKVTRLSAAMQSGVKLGDEPTQIGKEAGSSFTLFGGYIVGRQIELVQSVRIVQVWRVVTWSSGVYSIVKFELTGEGSGTKLVFDHAGFPNGQGQHLAEGWKENYWAPLERFLKAN